MAARTSTSTMRLDVARRVTAARADSSIALSVGDADLAPVAVSLPTYAPFGLAEAGHGVQQNENWKPEPLGSRL